MQLPELEDTVTREFYGGAITLQLPQRFTDVSDFRPVPDHQEVWADASEDQSLVCEIVEHDASVTDADCARHYWDDQVTANESSTSMVEAAKTLSSTDVPLMSPDHVSYACWVAGVQTVSKARQSQATANQVSVQLVVLRMPQVSSDILLTLNSPIVIAEASQAAEHAGAGLKQRYVHASTLMKQILSSFAVRDWGLFGQ